MLFLVAAWAAVAALLAAIFPLTPGFSPADAVAATLAAAVTAAVTYSSKCIFATARWMQRARTARLADLALVSAPAVPALLGAAGNALIVALWGVDRLWGLPLGPDRWQPEPVGFGDAVTSGFEVLLVSACIALLVRGRGGALRRVPMLALTCGALALTTLSLLSIIGVGSSVLTPTQ